MGSLTIFVSNYDQLQQVAQRVLCWAAADAGRVETVTTPNTAIRIPEAIFAGKGALNLRRGGADLLSGYVAGTDISVTVNNSVTAVGQAPVPTCPASTNQPTIVSMTTNVGNNPLAVTLNYANVAAAGLVNVSWGDGTFTNGAAESNAALAHTYPAGGLGFARTVTVTDATDATQFAQSVFVV